MDIHTKLHYAGIAIALGLPSTALVHTPAPVHEAAIHQVQKPSQFDWASLGQDKTIALGKALKGMEPGKVTFYCNTAYCHDLMLDLDDAFQLADWQREVEERQVASEHDKGIFVGPPGKDADAMVSALSKVGLRASVVGISDENGKPIEGVGIIVGKTDR
jgi:hypothetical protein